MEKIIYYPVFFTATIRHWKRLLKPDKYKEIILEQLREQIKKNQLIVYAYCIMDNHIHIIWQVKGDMKTSEVQKQFLEGCSKHIKADLELHHPNVLPFFKATQNDRNYHFWKRCPKSKELYDNDIFEQKFDYIHHNPVKAGLCNMPEEYLYSSAGYYETGIEFRQGILTHYRG
jgi:REP element-mobilizing transposase RayT